MDHGLKHPDGEGRSAASTDNRHPVYLGSPPGVRQPEFQLRTQAGKGTGFTHAFRIVYFLYSAYCDVSQFLIYSYGLYKARQWPTSQYANGIDPTSFEILITRNMERVASNRRKCLQEMHLNQTIGGTVASKWFVGPKSMRKPSWRCLR